MAAFKTHVNDAAVLLDLSLSCDSHVACACIASSGAPRTQLAKMVKRPVISIISQQLFNFENENGVSVYVHYYPHLVGTRFGDLPYLFPDGIVMGLVDRATGKTRWVGVSRASLALCASVKAHGCSTLPTPARWPFYHPAEWHQAGTAMCRPPMHWWCAAPQASAAMATCRWHHRPASSS